MLKTTSLASLVAAFIIGNLLGYYAPTRTTDEVTVTAPFTAVSQVLAPVAHEASVNAAWWQGSNAATSDLCAAVGGTVKDVETYAWCDLK